ncbi:MAG TPA: ABC transporter substrate-binding protein [Lachnoclostridium phytofermentans]|uniref:ABC transporter substrate-binding protein n=1 Tax=Lachnoclostridium phytofermentans TaxID=66219 RepID=A0A3D2X6Z4_9FIRM|nr:extracellular solute-binding protein [Lachnoclostridium sp.]HCL02899.1 ABC transporter substrate-binding protein [Lachnoclostridium phytofermentans]
MKKRVLCFVVVLTMVLTLFAGCGGGKQGAKEPAISDTGTTTTISDKTPETTPDTKTSEPKTLEPITFTFFDKNTGDPWSNPISDEITKRTGVTIEMQQPSGDPLEKLNIMLAAGDYPDFILMDRSNDIVNKYIAAGALVNLDEYIEKSGTDIKEMYGDVLTKTRYKDGSNYYLSNWYGKDPDCVNGFLIQFDLLKEVAPEKVANHESFTEDEMIDALNKLKEKYPTINGKETIPLTLWGENQDSYMGTFRGMYGIKTYYEDNGQLFYNVRDPKFVKALSFANRLYREGLIEKEWVINKRELWLQKLSAGNVLGTLSAYWEPADANTILMADKGDEGQMVGFKVVGEGIDPDKTTLGGRSSLGWDAIAMTKNCKDPQRGFEFMNYLASEEGQELLLWGMEGEHWNMVDGKRTPKTELLDSFKNDWTKTKQETGVREWIWFVKNGPAKDGQPYDMAAKYRIEFQQSETNKNLTNTYWDTADYDNLIPSGGTPESLKYQKTKDIMDQAIPKIINCSSEEEVQKLYDKMISDMESAGMADVEKVINTNYAERKALWGIK